MGETSIPCTEATRDRLRDDKPQGVSWDRYLKQLADGATPRADADITATVTPTLDDEAVDELVDELQSRLSEADPASDQLNTIESRTGRIEQLLESLAEGRR